MSDSDQVMCGYYSLNSAALERNLSESSDTFEEELTLIMDSDLEEDAFCIGDDANYSDLDAQIYTDWANHYLEKARNKRSITDLQQDVSDGVLLADVIEAVTNEKVRDIKTKPRNATQMVENINACLSYLASLGVSTEGISAKDIREGNLKAILGLFFSLSRYKQQQKQAAAANLSNVRNGTIVNNVNQTTTESKLPLLNKQSRCPTVPNPSSKEPASQQPSSNLNRKSFSFNAADRTKHLNQQNNNLSFSSGSVPRPGSHQSRDSATSASSRSTSPSASRQTGIPTPGSRLAATRSRSPTGSRSVGRSQSLSDKTAHRITNNSTSTSSASSGKTNSSATSASRGTAGTTSGYTSSASSSVSNRTATNNKNSMLDKFKFFGSKEKGAKQGTLPKSGASAKDSKPEPQLSPKSKKKLIGSSKKPKEVKDEPPRPESRLRPVTPPANAGHLIQRSATPPAPYGGRSIQRPVTPPASYGRQVQPPQQPKSRQPSPQSLRRNGGIPKSDSKTDLKTPCRTKAPPTTLVSGVTKQASTGLNSPNSAVPLPNTGIPKPGSKPVSAKPIGKEEKRLKELKRSQTPTRNGNGNYDQVYEPSSRDEPRGHYSDQSQSLKLSRNVSESQAIARGQRSLDRNANLATKNQPSSRKTSPTDETYRSLPKKKVSGSTQTTTPSSQNGSPRRKLPSPPQEKKSPIEEKKLVKPTSETTSSKSDSSTGTVVNSKYVKTQPKKAETTHESSNEKPNSQESNPEKKENEDEQNNMEVKPMAPLQRPSPYAYLPRLPNGQPQPAGGGQRQPMQQQPGPLMSQYGSSQRLRTMMANGQYLSSMKHGGSGSAMSSDDYASDCDLDLGTGYMSDGDILRKNQPEDYSGYMSEGGASMYARKMQQKFREGMMQAVEECMRKSNNLVDDDSFDDSSSISSGDISDTIGDISTDENLGSTHSAADYNRTPRQQDYSSGIYTSPKRGPTTTNATVQSQQQLAARNYTGYDYTAWRKSSSNAPSEGGDGNYMHLDYSSEPDTSTLNSWRKRGQHQQQPDYKPGYYATSSLRRNSDYAQHQLSSTENLIGGTPAGNKQQRCPPPADPDSMIIMRKSNQQPVATGMPMSTFGYRRPVSTSSDKGDPPCPPTRSLNGKPPVQKRTGRSDYENIYTTPDGSPRRSAAQQQNSDPTALAQSEQRRNYNNPQEESPRRSMVGSKTQTFTSTQEQIDDAYKSNTLGRRRPGQQNHHQMPIYGSGTNLQKAFSQDKLLSSIYGNPQAMYASIRYNAQSDRSRSMSIPNSIPNPTNPQTWLNGESTENLTTAEKIQQARAIAKGYRDSLNMEKMTLEHTHKRSQSQSLDQSTPRSSCNQLYSAPVSPTPSTQSASRFTYPMTALSPSHVAKSTSNQSLARSSSQQGMPYQGLMSKSVSRDDDFHGSSLSLASSSSLYSTPNEEKQAAEIRKLRRELESAQEKVATLTSQLSTNAHVVSAFEQSLSNMTQRLQTLTSSSHQKDSELNELKETIESLRLQSGGIRIDPNTSSTHRRVSAPAPPTPLSVYSSPEHCLSSPGPLTRQLSTESMSSVNSMSSACSMTSQQSAAGSKDKGDRKNKGGWLRSSFSKAFSKQKKNRKGSMSDVEGDSVSISSDISVPNSPLLMTSSNMASTLPGAYGSTAPSNGIKQSHSESRLTEDVDSVHRLQQKLQEKDMKLTDIQLEALSSAHQLETLRETMIKMKNEMSTLKADNDRLQKMVVTKSSNPTSPEHSMKRTSLDDLDKSYLLQEHASNIDVLLNDTSTDGRRVLISVYLGNDTDVSSLVKTSSPEVLIGSMCVTGKIRWDMLDSIIRRYFKDYCIKVDPACHLGLNSESVYSYHIGDIVRKKDAAETPELLPCGYLVGEDMQIKIVLKGTEQQAIDSLAFETLIPKSIIQRYISLLVEHRRIILCGPSGTGKTYLAHKLAEFLVRRSGRPLDASAISTFSVEHKSSKELRQYLASIADQCQNPGASRGGNETLPCVIILDNLHHVGSLSEVFDGFLSCKYQKSPYIIGTMNQATCSTTNLQLHHNFRWVLCANHMEPVKGFLGRFLKRKLIEAELRCGRRDPDLAKMVEWMPQVWQKLNKFLETHSSSDVTVGPRLFLSCPMDISGSQVWFTDLYNYSLVPYLMDATREGLQLYGRRATWEDPAEWVMQHYPWPSPDTQDNPALLRIRPEDVGYDSQTMAAPGTLNKTPQPNQSQESDQDPLLNMLMRLQEAASYSSPQSADSDSQSQEEGKPSQESTI